MCFGTKAGVAKRSAKKSCLAKCCGEKGGLGKHYGKNVQYSLKSSTLAKIKVV